MSTKGGPDFTFNLPGGRFAPLPPVSYATDHLHQKCQIQHYQDKDRLSECMVLLLRWKPKLGHMRPAGRGLDIADLELFTSQLLGKKS